MVECESTETVRRTRQKIVLIDTWWNVNSIQCIRQAAQGMVLIDTWWNVNEEVRFSEVRKVDCFNRYMVECELSSSFASATCSSVLIDTWWNVNILV